jgi:hypothetical protein
VTNGQELGRLVKYLNEYFPNALKPSCNTVDVVMKLLTETIRLAKNAQRIELGFADTERLEWLQAQFDHGVKFTRSLIRRRFRIVDSKRSAFPIRPHIDAIMKLQAAEGQKGARNESEADQD